MPSKVPALLEPYVPGVAEEQGSLTVLTGIQGSTTNWVVLRYLISLLQQQEDTGVVLVSFLRDFAFWKESATRLGLDLEAQRTNGKFSFLDGVTGMFSTGTQGVIRGYKTQDVKTPIEAALAGIKTSRKILVVDQLDALLAMGETDALSLQNTVLALREVSHSAVLTFMADSPLVQSQTTALEREHASLTLGLIHAADQVVSLRKLDTGAAGDVSGVIRVSIQGKESAELLYHVAGDGGVRVFERGT